MDFWRSVYDSLMPIYFLVGFALFLHLLVWMRLPRKVWERMTQLSCIMAAAGLMGLAASGRINFAEEMLEGFKSRLQDNYRAAKQKAHELGNIYSFGVGELPRYRREDWEKMKEADRYFSRAVELLERGFEAGAWRELLDQDTPLKTMSEQQRIDFIRRMGIWSVDEKVFLPYADQKDWMLSFLRTVVRLSANIDEFEVNKKRRLEETILSLFWPYFVSLSIAIQFGKASAAIRGFDD